MRVISCLLTTAKPPTAVPLDRCMARAKEMMHWDEKYPCRDMGNGKVRSVGVAMCMQGSSISNLDVGSITLKLNDDGFYTMMIGASDMGTGCDTTLAQIAADVLGCDLENIVSHGVDTDVSPYDSALRVQYRLPDRHGGCEGIQLHGTPDYREGRGVSGEKSRKRWIFDGEQVFAKDGSASISLKDIGNRAMANNGKALEVTESHSSPVSPPPFMVGMAEIEMDKGNL